MRPIALTALAVLLIGVAQPVQANPVTEDYLIATYHATKDYAVSIRTLISLRPGEKPLRAFAFESLRADYERVKGMQPPPDFQGMKQRMLRAMEFQMASLQLAIQGKPGAMSYWNKSKAEVNAIEAFLAQRKADQGAPPPLDPGFRPQETQLTPQQYADRYFLVRLANRTLGTQLALGGKRKQGKVDHTLAVLKSQTALLQKTKCPPEMKDIQDKVLKTQELSEEWIHLQVANKLAQANAKQQEILGLYNEIDDELSQKHKINVPPIVRK